MGEKNFTKIELGKWYVRENGDILKLNCSWGFDETGESVCGLSYNLANEIEPPVIIPKKRKVVKEIVRYANIYPNDLPNIYRTKELADMNAMITRIACVELKGTYEVEE